MHNVYVSFETCSSSFADISALSPRALYIYVVTMRLCSFYFERERNSHFLIGFFFFAHFSNHTISLIKLRNERVASQKTQ